MTLFRGFEVHLLIAILFQPCPGPPSQSGRDCTPIVTPSRDSIHDARASLAVVDVEMLVQEKIDSCWIDRVEEGKLGWTTQSNRIV
jgi:hypothetical protein